MNHDKDTTPDERFHRVTKAAKPAMRLADLDIETRRVVYLAHIVTLRPGDPVVMEKLRQAITAFDLKHETERAANLMNALADVMANEPDERMGRTERLEARIDADKAECGYCKFTGTNDEVRAHLGPDLFCPDRIRGKLCTDVRCGLPADHAGPCAEDEFEDRDEDNTANLGLEGRG